MYDIVLVELFCVVDIFHLYHNPHRDTCTCRASTSSIRHAFPQRHYTHYDTSLHNAQYSALARALYVASVRLR